MAPPAGRYDWTRRTRPELIIIWRKVEPLTTDASDPRHNRPRAQTATTAMSDKSTLEPLVGVEFLPLAATTAATPPPAPPAVTKKVRKAPEKPKKRRSRNGCFSCKKLKIKCDEARPSCEYCSHTGRICVFPPSSAHFDGADAARSGSASSNGSDSTTTRHSSSMTSASSVDQEEEYYGRKIISDLMLVNDVSNTYMKNLNSMQNQMRLTRFEQKLLKFYLDFSGAFFTGNKNMEAKNVIEIDVPKLWNQSPMMKTAMYAVSSMYLWRFYQLNHISNIYLSGDQYLVVHTNNDPMSKSLFEITDNYIQSTFRLLREGLLHLNLLTNVDQVGAVILTNVFLFTTISVHPVSHSLLTAMNGSTNYLVDICQISSGIFGVADARPDLTEGSSYELLLYRDEVSIRPPLDEPTMFPFIAHLYEYVNFRVHREDVLFQVYHLAIAEFEASCFRAVKFGYVLPILRAIMGISTNLTFLELLRDKDYTAMKIMFYYCSVVSICGIKMFSEASLWDSFVDEFKQWVDTNIGGFEEEFDVAMYGHVCERVADSYKRRGKPFLDAEQLLLIGSGRPLVSAPPMAQKPM